MNGERERERKIQSSLGEGYFSHDAPPASRSRLINQPSDRACPIYEVKWKIERAGLNGGDRKGRKSMVPSGEFVAGMEKKCGRDIESFLLQKNDRGLTRRLLDTMNIHENPFSHCK